MTMTAEEIILDISTDIHPADHLLRFLREHPQIGERARAEYFSSGRECALKLRNLIDEQRGATTGAHLLEFAAGYGRVTRHIRSLLPDVVTTACDIHPEAVQFLTDLGVQAAGSSSIPERFDLGRTFDVVFALSFFSHLPRATWTRWLRRLVDLAAQDGLVIFTTHGERSREFVAPNSPVSNKFLFVAQSEQKDLPVVEYGTSLTPFPYVYAEIAGLGGVRLVKFQEAGWFGHQDLYVLRRTDERRSIWRRLIRRKAPI